MVSHVELGTPPRMKLMHTRDRPPGGPLQVLQAFTVEAERYMEVSRRLAGLGHNDVHALSAVVEAAKHGVVMTPGALRRRLVLSPAATTALVDRLVAHGLLRREKAATDGRTVELHATAEARQMGRCMFMALSEEIMDQVMSYTPQQQQQLITMMTELTDAARRARERLEDGALPLNGSAPDVPAWP